MPANLKSSELLKNTFSGGTKADLLFGDAWLGERFSSLTLPILGYDSSGLSANLDELGSFERWLEFT